MRTHYLIILYMFTNEKPTSKTDIKVIINSIFVVSSWCIVLLFIYMKDVSF